MACNATKQQCHCQFSRKSQRLLPSHNINVERKIPTMHQLYARKEKRLAEDMNSLMSIVLAAALLMLGGLKKASKWLPLSTWTFVVGR
jgi:hypothetical protein